MEVSTQSNSAQFGCYSDHQVVQLELEALQGVSYEDESFDARDYGKEFALAFAAKEAHLGSLDDDEMLSYDGSLTSSMEDGVWEDENGSEGSDLDDFCDDNDDSTESQLVDANKAGVTVLAASTEMLRIRFPFLSISVRLADFLCLQEKDLLNDTIVDFYLNHIVEHLLPDEPDKRVTVLPAVFWHNLSILQSALPEEYETMSSSEQLDVRFADVLEFLEEFEFLDVDYLVIPVNEWEHWSLAIVCHPFTDRARIVCFDSQINDDPNNLKQSAAVIEEFLKYAWEHRSGGGRPFHPLGCVVPVNLPQQVNNYDCGLFVLEYARRFLMVTPEKLDQVNFGSLYSDFSVDGKRREIQRTILSLTANRNTWLPLLDLIESRSNSSE